MESPERFIELTWEGIKNKYQYAGGRDEAAAAAMASKLLWGYDDPQKAIKILEYTKDIICGVREMS